MLARDCHVPDTFKPLEAAARDEFPILVTADAMMMIVHINLNSFVFMIFILKQIPE